MDKNVGSIVTRRLTFLSEQGFMLGLCLSMKVVASWLGRASKPSGAGPQALPGEVTRGRSWSSISTTRHVSHGQRWIGSDCHLTCAVESSSTERISDGCVEDDAGLIGRIDREPGLCVSLFLRFVQYGSKKTHVTSGNKC